MILVRGKNLSKNLFTDLTSLFLIGMPGIGAHDVRHQACLMISVSSSWTISMPSIPRRMPMTWRSPDTVPGQVDLGVAGDDGLGTKAKTSQNIFICSGVVF